MMPAPFRRLSSEEQARLAVEIQRRVGVRPLRNEPLAPYTTMRVGGPADLFAVARNVFELRGLVRLAGLRGVPLFLLGRGSDLVISDRGVGGLVVRVRAEGIRVEGTRITAEGGVPMARLATVARSHSLTGAEFALAIPGTVGGAVWANAGAHGSDLRSLLVEASVIIDAGAAEATFDADGLGLAYRDSRLKHPQGSVPEVVTWATLALTSGAVDAIDRRLDEIRRWRRTHQPLGLPSAGSVFRNPAEGRSAGELIERAGLKGRRIGGASVSVQHANFIVNDGHGTAADVRHLAELIRREVADRFGVLLQPEVVFAGDWSGWEEGAS